MCFLSWMINNEQSLMARPPPPIDQHSRVQRVFFCSICRRELIVFFCFFFRISLFCRHNGPLVYEIQFSTESNPDEDALYNIIVAEFGTGDAHDGCIVSSRRKQRCCIL